LKGEEPKAEQYMVLGTHFPKWFLNNKGVLKKYSDWKELWINNGLGVETFVPPRDASKPIKDVNGNIKTINIPSKRGEHSYKLYNLLSQTNLILICPNGHLSDIPWPKFLQWKSQKKEKQDNGESLFTLDNCCSAPDLKWTESKTKSEGYGSIYLECVNCGCGSGNENQPKINLEGINNLRPNCLGHKPWEIDLGQDSHHVIPFENCFKKGESRNGSENMQVALVTGNNIYYATGFSSLFIPQHLAENKSTELINAITKCNEKYLKYLKVKPQFTKEEFMDRLDKEDFMIENKIVSNDINAFFVKLKEGFLDLNPEDENVDKHEFYRWQEYTCFINNSSIKEDGLVFEDILLPKDLSVFFSKIQQIEELKVTQVQLEFTRVKPKERIKVNDEIRVSGKGKNIYSLNDDEVFVLPANETYGEGLFFQFNDEQISDWISQNQSSLNERFKNFSKDIDLNSQGASIKQRIKNNGLKHFLIHTFSHILMRELEFSCGYPTASLKERLYISDRMSGVLIYTAEGSEGSMGGLVWQGYPSKIMDLIIKGLERSINCSSDPLCWESEGQGIFNLNLAACFSCTLVSETACEEMNLGLDRIVLIDEKIGFFKKLLGIK